MCTAVCIKSVNLSVNLNQSQSQEKGSWGQSRAALILVKWKSQCHLIYTLDLQDHSPEIPHCITSWALPQCI